MKIVKNGVESVRYSEMGAAEYLIASKELERDCIAVRSIGFGQTDKGTALPVVGIEGEMKDWEAYRDWKGWVSWLATEEDGIAESIFLDISFDNGKHLKFKFRPSFILERWLELVIKSEGLVSIINSAGEALLTVKTPVSVLEQILESGAITFPRGEFEIGYVTGIVYCFDTKDEMDRAYTQLGNHKPELDLIGVIILKAHDQCEDAGYPWAMALVCNQASLSALDEFLVETRERKEIDFTPSETGIGWERIMEFMQMQSVKE